jgi:hypothetical protein
MAATNSLKIQVARNSGRNKPYIWIDPSWEIFHRGQSVISSANYPHYESPLYIYKHRSWCKKKQQISGKILLSVRLNKLGQTVFRLSKGYEIVCYGYNFELNDDDYDAWYADAS